MRKRALTSLSLALFVAGVALVIAHGDAVLVLRHRFDAWGAWGVLALIALEAVWTLSTVPSTPVMLLSGLLYGPWLGSLYVVLGGLLGTSATFWIGRTVGREHVCGWIARHQPLSKVLRMIERHPAISILLVRAVPVFPLNLLNYGFGLTNMRFPTYLATSGVVMFPGAALYTGLGEALRRTAAGEGLPWWVVGWVGAFALLTAALIWFAKRRAGLSEPERNG